MNDLSETVYNLVASLAIVVGGGWTFWRFVLHRDQFPKPEFSLDLKVVGQQNDRHLIEISAILTNKSTVRLKIRKFHFSLFFIRSKHGLEDGGDKINFMTKFEALIKKRLWMKHLAESDEYTFVDAGTTQRYSYITSLPGDATFALVQSAFSYKEKASEFHSAQKSFRIKKVIQ